MSVLEYWWKEFLSHKLHQSKLVAFLEDQNLWLFQLDDVNDDTFHGMRWDAVMKYADGEASTYTDYHLPAVPVPSSSMEAVIQGEKVCL